MSGAGQRHYLSYVREDLIASWKIQAILNAKETMNQPHVQQKERNREAERKRAALGGDSLKVWPWAFQLGHTPAARSLKAGDVLWIVARLSGMGQNWPPALVARMALAEDAHCGPRDRESRKGLTFPFRFGVAVFASPDGGDFFPANDATVALLKTDYQTPLAGTNRLGEMPWSLDAHVKAWQVSSRKGFQSLRRIIDPTPLEAFAERLARCSVFISYRWSDHPVDGPAFTRLRDVAEELMVRHRIGVWLDHLTLPPSKHAEWQRRVVIERLLYTPLQETPLLVAHMTDTYGGASKDDPCQPGYTLIEWGAAKRILAWGQVASRYAGRLREQATPDHWCSPACSVAEVAGEVDRLLRGSA